MGAEGDGKLVNYRFRSPYYIVDRLFGAAELRLGDDRRTARKRAGEDGGGAEQLRVVFRSPELGEF